jgi:hypothetical protein
MGRRGCRAQTVEFGLLPLMRCQLGLGAEPDATSLRALPPFASPGADQLSLEPGKPPSTVSMSRPCSVMVSAQASASDLNSALAFGWIDVHC